MLDKELLKTKILKCRQQTDSKDFRTVIETLLKIHRNILNNEDVIQFRQIKINNEAFRIKIWKFYAARQIMQTCGWIKRRDVDLLIFNYDERLLDIIDILLEFRFIKPSDSEWNEVTKLEGPSKAQLHEEELKQKAAEERKRALEAFKKDKEYRENLAKNVKAEHEADKYRNKILRQVEENPQQSQRIVTLQSLQEKKD